MLAAVVLAVYFGTRKAPDGGTPPPVRPAEGAKPEVLARGKYLFEHGSACIYCHSEHDTAFWGWPVKPETAGAGQCFDGKTFGLPATVCAPNLTNTPEGLGRWTDEQIITAIREGLDWKGRPLDPMMPYEEFRNMSDEDVRAVVAYLRTLPPSAKTYPVPTADHLPPAPIVPRLTGPVAAVHRGDPGYGEYMAHIALCGHCHHSQEEHPRPFGGGGEFDGPAGREIAANLTSHPTGVTGRLTKEQFVGMFESWGTIEPTPSPTGPQKAIMPRLVFGGMTADDVGAIYDYIHAQPPVDSTPAVAAPGQKGDQPVGDK